MLGWPDGRRRPLLFDGSPLLPSAVYAETDGRLLTGADAVRSARTDPGRYEPHPKRRIDDGTLLLGDTEYPVAELLAATLRRVREEAVRTAAAPPAPVTLTYPASWGPTRRAILLDAARRAGMPAPVLLLPEPVAAGCYFTMAVRSVPPGRCIVVYDLGAGTFDVSVLRQQADGFEVLGVDGLPDFGGLDLDALLVGGSTRTPLVATVLHRALGVAPTVREQPELVVAEGALCAGGDRPAAARPVAPPARDRVVFTPASGATASAARHAFVAFAIAVGVYVFTGAASQKLSWRTGFQDTLQLLSAILAIVFAVLLTYAVLVRRRPALVVDEDGMTVHGRGGTAQLRWTDLTEVEFCDDTLWVRAAPGSPLELGGRWDPDRGAARVVELADLHAAPDAVYAAVSRHSTVPVTVTDT